MRFKVSKEALLRVSPSIEMDIADWTMLPDFITLEGEPHGQCYHSADYSNTCPCRCHKPAPQLPEELPEFIEEEPTHSVEFWNRLRINELIRYLKHQQKSPADQRGSE